jgi:hypothetical protein
MMDEGGRLMKYMLIHCIDENVERNRKPEEYEQGSPAIEDWITEMEGRGVLLHGDRLRYVSDAATVRVRSKELLVSDGPFAETKEQIPGFDVIDCTGRGHRDSVQASDGLVGHDRGSPDRGESLRRRRARLRSRLRPFRLIPMYRAVS